MWFVRCCSLLEGGDFKAGEQLLPDQHIFRAINPFWPLPADDVSKFTVRQHLYPSRGPGRHGYWSPYDLLGLFLSGVGPAPLGANKRNFYLPMTAVYGRWCMQIAGQGLKGRGKGVGDPPFMFQCTWRVKDGQPPSFFLGSSLAGYNWDKAETGEWEIVLKQERFGLIHTLVELGGYSFEDSPMRRRNKDMGTRFGNCAETYPFLALMEYA